MLSIIKSVNKMILNSYKKKKHLCFYNIHVRIDGKYCPQTVCVWLFIKACELSHNLDSGKGAMKYM